jgi:hypothetical protein
VSNTIRKTTDGSRSVSDKLNKLCLDFNLIFEKKFHKNMETRDVKLGIKMEFSSLWMKRIVSVSFNNGKVNNKSAGYTIYWVL